MESSKNIKFNRVICDNGSGYVKLGFGADTFPRYVIPSIVGRPVLRASQKIGDVEVKELMVGDEAAPLRAYLEVAYPLTEGLVKNWEDMCHIWDYSFKKLGLPEDKSEHSILLTEAA